MIDYQASNIINAALNLDLKSAAGLDKFRKVVQSALEEASQQSVQADDDDKCDCGEPFPENGECEFCGVHQRHRG